MSMSSFSKLYLLINGGLLAWDYFIDIRGVLNEDVLTWVKFLLFVDLCINTYAPYFSLRVACAGGTEAYNAMVMRNHPNHGRMVEGRDMYTGLTEGQSAKHAVQMSMVCLTGWFMIYLWAGNIVDDMDCKKRGEGGETCALVWDQFIESMIDFGWKLFYVFLGEMFPKLLELHDNAKEVKDRVEQVGFEI